MLALGTLTRLSGIDSTLGLAFAATGVFYPFFGTLLGWLGVALTGSDTASNILFGNLQKVTSAAGAFADPDGGCELVGGVMGKMIDAQSIVVASLRPLVRTRRAVFCASSSGTRSCLPALSVCW